MALSQDLAPVCLSAVGAFLIPDLSSIVVDYLFTTKTIEVSYCIYNPYIAIHPDHGSLVLDYHGQTMLNFDTKQWTEFHQGPAYEESCRIDESGGTVYQIRIPEKIISLQGGTRYPGAEPLLEAIATRQGYIRQGFSVQTFNGELVGITVLVSSDKERRWFRLYKMDRPRQQAELLWECAMTQWEDHFECGALHWNSKTESGCGLFVDGRKRMQIWEFSLREGAHLMVLKTLEKPVNRVCISESHRVAYVLHDSESDIYDDMYDILNASHCITRFFF